MRAEVFKQLDNIKSIKENIQQVEGISGVLKEKLSEAQVLFTRVPIELQSRYDYLRMNLNYRYEFENLLEKFYEWISQSEKILNIAEEGFDFDHIATELEDLTVSIVLLNIVYRQA